MLSQTAHFLRQSYSARLSDLACCISVFLYLQHRMVLDKQSITDLRYLSHQLQLLSFKRRSYPEHLCFQTNYWSVWLVNDGWARMNRPFLAMSPSLSHTSSFFESFKWFLTYILHLSLWLQQNLFSKWDSEMTCKGISFCCYKSFFSQLVGRWAHTIGIMTIQDFLTLSALGYSNILQTNISPGHP